MTPAEVEAKTADLVARLEKKAVDHSLVYGGLGIYQEAADALSAQAAEIERMREALAEARQAMKYAFDHITGEKVDGRTVTTLALAIQTADRQALTGKDG